MDRCVCCRGSAMYVSVHTVWDWPVMCGDCIEKYPHVHEAAEKTWDAIAKLEEAVTPIREEARKNLIIEKEKT